MSVRTRSFVTPGVFALVSLGGCLSADVAETDGSSGESGSSGDEGSSGHLPVMTTTMGDAPEDEGGMRPPVNRECTPGEAESCTYRGPAGTNHVGVCRAATRTCDEEGQWGGCEGAVLPRAEDCRTDADENCDGQAQCTGEVEWVRGFGEPNGGQQGWVGVYDVDVDARGRLWFTGTFMGSLQVGKESWTDLDSHSYFLGRVGASGDPEFAYADARGGVVSFGQALALDAVGNVGVAAVSQTTLKFADEAPIRAHETGWYFSGVGFHDAAGGYRHDVRMTNLSDGGVLPNDMSVDSAGNVWVVGLFGGSHAKLGEDPGAVILEDHGGTDAFLVKMTPDGAIALAYSFGDAADQEFLGVDIDASDNVWLVGRHTGLLQFQGGGLVAPADDEAQFVVKLDSAGRWAWGFSYGGAGKQSFSEVVADADGGAVVAGSYTAPNLSLGGHVTSKGEGDLALIVARYDSHGNVRWARSWPCFGACALGSLAMDGAGQTVITAGISGDGALTVGDATLKGQSGKDMTALVKFDRDGEPVWAPRVHDAQVVVATGPTGSIYLAGGYGGKVSFGDGPELELDAGANDIDLLVARLRP